MFARPIYRRFPQLGPLSPPTSAFRIPRTALWADKSSRTDVPSSRQEPYSYGLPRAAIHCTHGIAFLRYLFRGLIRETGKTVEGAVDADTPEDALNALSANGIVTEDLTPAPMPVSSLAPSARAGYAPRTAGAAGPPPLPPGFEVSGSVPAENIAHPGLNSSDPVERAFAAASQAVSFDAVAQRYRGKSVWVIDRDKIRRQVATIVDQTLQELESKQQQQYDGDKVRESVASALKEMFKDNRNIASQQTPEQAQAAQGGGGMAVSSPQLEAQIGRLEDFLVRAETVLTQLQVAAKRLAAGGGGGFAPRRMSHIPKPRGEEQNEVLLEIFRSNVKLRQNLAKARGQKFEAPPGLLPDEPSAAAASNTETEPAQAAG